MPIYRQSYRTYDGTPRRQFRWWIMVKHEIRTLSKSRAFLVLIILGYVHACFRLLQVVTFDTLNATPNNPLARALQNIQAFTVDESMFFDFIRLQSGLVFLATILAGAGMICDDYRNNLMEIYFSKPLTWRDYVVGKVMTLVLVGLAFTAVPALALLLAHLFLAGNFADAFRLAQWLPGPILGFSLTLVVPCAVGVLASSALSRSQRYASIGVFMALFGDLVIGRLLPDLLHHRNYAIFAFPLAINRIGEVLFDQRRPLFDLAWHWPAVYVAVVCLVCLWIICRRVRRAEIAL